MIWQAGGHDHMRSQPNLDTPTSLTMPPPPLRWGWQRRALLSPLLSQCPIRPPLRTVHTRPSLPSTSLPRLRPPLRPTLRPPPTPPPLLVRVFHASPPRRDILFLSMPALKSTLLGITRFSLLALPFVWRYKWDPVPAPLTPGYGASTSARPGSSFRYR